jgi:hypothetical protein
MVMPKEGELLGHVIKLVGGDNIIVPAELSDILYFNRKQESVWSYFQICQIKHRQIGGLEIR